MSHAVEVALSHLLDHMHALRTMIADAGTIHMVAPFTLMRSAMENAALAAWLLLPDDQKERVRRRLMLAIQDASYGFQVRYLTEPAINESFEQRRERLVGIGVAHGLEQGSLMGKMAGWKNIVREAGAAIGHGADGCEVMWRLCRGFTHGRTWSLLATLDQETVREADDVFELRMTAPAGTVLVVATAAADVLGRALLLHNRHRLHFRQHKREEKRPVSTYDAGANPGGVRVGRVGGAGRASPRCASSGI